MTPFMEAVAQGGLVADGAMGTALYERGIFANRSFDELNVSQPEVVYKLQHEYVLAGAHIIETNTYGANRLRLQRHGLDDQFTRINQEGARVARRAGEDAVYIAASLGPTGLDAGAIRRGEKQIRKTYAEQAYILAEEGCDLISIETFLWPEQMRMAIEAVRESTTLPIMAQMKVDDDGDAGDGTNAADFAAELVAWGADIIGVNCNGPTVIFEAAQAMLGKGVPVCAMPNAGRPQEVEDRLIYVATPENFGVYARRMYKAGVSIVGGCCGTNPEHIRRVASAARMVAPNSRAAIQVSAPHDAGKPQRPIEQRSNFGALLGRKFVTSVEVNPRAGLDINKAIDAARMLRQHGADVINIADGPRATARMSNLALCVKMQEELGSDVLMHVCCRDRNLLGLQAHLLGAHVLGIRNLVIITGDPPKMGDFPDATAVYDVDSIGLLKIASDLNRALDPGGKSTPEQTDFVLITGAEPAARDFEREMMRLRQKIDAGAEVVMTQPIYDPSHLERFLEAMKDVEIPILVGILPLASARNAEFLHNNVPGMGVPEEIRRRMKAAGSGDSARQEGVNIAVESLMGVKDRVAGAYIMPPLGRYDMAAAILDAIGASESDSGAAASGSA